MDTPDGKWYAMLFQDSGAVGRLPILLPVDVYKRQATGGVRYTVPSTINTAQMDDTVTVRFRVGAVYKNCYIACLLYTSE